MLSEYRKVTWRMLGWADSPYTQYLSLDITISLLAGEIAFLLLGTYRIELCPLPYTSQFNQVFSQQKRKEKKRNGGFETI